MSSKFEMNTEELAFVIPFKTDHGRREEIFNWNVSRLKKFFPGCQICIGEQDSELFNLSQARNNGIRKVDRPFLFSIDADTAWNPELIIDSVHALESHRWVIPYMVYLQTDMNSGLRITKEDPETILIYSNYQYHAELIVPPNDPMPPVSGIVGMHTIDMFYLGGFDERFDGWGWEDRAFAITAERLLGQSAKRINHMVYHLWHEVGPTINQPKYHANWDLYRQYESHFNKIHKKYL
jgi:hypothetical protein